MSHNIYITFLRTGLSIVILFSSGCKKFVDVDAPRTQLVTSSVFSNSSTANAALTAIYSSMMNEYSMPYTLAYYCGLSSDELTSYSSFQNIEQFYNNSISPANDDLLYNIWTTSFNYIYQANAIIEGLNNSTGISSLVKQQVTGEAMFVRAFWYFYLVNLFGDIPLLLTTDYNKTAATPRSPKSIVYEKIIADLKSAKLLLAENFVGNDGISPSSERVRVTKWAAATLLARVYLYTLNYVNAENEATEVINRTDLFNLSNLSDIFLMNSSEAIWQLQPAFTTLNTPEGQKFILQGPPETGSERSSTMSQSLLSEFEENDLRKSAWVGQLDDYYFPFKYKAIDDGSPTSEYSMVLRLAELFLIRAESRVMLNNFDGAKSDLNVIRNRAGLNSLNTNDKESLINAIEHERRIEFFAEWGHRWLDLKRTERINIIMPLAAQEKGTNWNTDKQWYPIPQKEREANPNLTQNTGY